MRLTAEIRYAAAPDTVFAMLCDTTFQERKCEANGAIEYEVEVETFDDGGAVITTKRVLPTAGVPDFIKTFVGSTLRVIQIDDWGAPDEGGGRTGTTVVEIEGAPIRFTGSLTLDADADADADGTVESVDGDLKAAVPLLSGKIEKAAEPAIRSAIKAEQSTGTAWLTGG